MCLNASPPCSRQAFGSAPTHAAPLTAIDVAPDDWTIAGHKLASFYFDIRITDETNTKDEKAKYIREAFDGFRQILGELHEESYIYIYVQDVRAAAYGYGGRTQEARYLHPEA